MTAAARAAIDADRFLADPRSAIDRRAFAFELAGRPCTAWCWPADGKAVRITAEFWVALPGENKQQKVKASGFAVVERRGGMRITGDPETLVCQINYARILAALEVGPLSGELEAVA